MVAVYMIVAYTGLPGSGKSLALALGAVGDLLAGRDVYTNFLLRWDRILWLAWQRRYRWEVEPDRHWKQVVSRRLGRWRVMQTYEDMLSLREGRLYFDEAHIWLWARAYREIPREVISWWSQSRKHGIDVFFATQRMGSVDVQVRELAAVTWHCRRVGNTNYFLYQSEDMEAQGVRRRIFSRKVRRLDEGVADCYDTYEVLPPPWELQERDVVVSRSRTRSVPARPQVDGGGNLEAIASVLRGMASQGRPAGR